MSLRSLGRLIRRTGRIAEPAPPAPGARRTGTTTPGTGGVETAGTAARDEHDAAAPDPATSEAAASDPAAPDDDFVPPAALRGSAAVRHVDAGSCNGCEIELAAAFGPVYDVERYGARLVASPRHADVVLVTGVVTQNMAQPLRLTLAATPTPRVVIACGDCALGRGPLLDGYAVAGSAADVVPVDLQVPGCPPTPDQIVAALRRVTRR